MTSAKMPHHFFIAPLIPVFPNKCRLIVTDRSSRMWDIIVLLVNQVGDARTLLKNKRMAKEAQKFALLM